MVIGSERRARRRNRRSIGELDQDGRARLQRLLAGTRLVVTPTSDAISRVEARVAPGTTPLAVACPPGLGIDQTLAVSEVLAAHGYEVTPHLAARQVRTARQLGEILGRLARRAMRRVLVIQGEGEPVGDFRTSNQLLASMDAHSDAPPEVGIAGHPEGHPDAGGELLAARLLERAPHATFVSTQASRKAGRSLGWVTEMRVRGLELPIELGIPGMMPSEQLPRQGHGWAPAASPGRQPRGESYDPTGLLVELAAEPAVDRLAIAGLRLETLNQIDATATWRQQLYDLANAARVS